VRKLTSFKNHYFLIMPEERRLAAIMFTDIVGYTALMGKDEDKAFQILKINRKIHAQQIEKYNGILVKEMGDGILASFDSAIKAIECAIDIQNEAKWENIALRIGIHEADVVFEGSDVLGDGVNVASRLQELAKAGGINISGAVYKEIKNKAGFKTEFIKEKKLKNVDDPVKIYEVEFEEEYDKSIQGPDFQEKKRNKKLFYILIAGVLVIIATIILILSNFLKQPGSSELSKTLPEEKISIAVLPFDNLSGDPALDFMCDGLTEEIIHHLSIIKEFDRVISRNSAMSFKNTEKTTPEIAEQLNVNTILEGSYRQYGERSRITAQLIEAKTDRHIWSENYDRPVGDILEIQSDIAIKIAQSLKIELDLSTERKIENASTINHDAYVLLKKAEYLFWNGGDFDGMIDLIKQSLEIDPNYSNAYRFMGFAYILRGSWVGDISIQEAIRVARPYIEKSLELDPNNANGIQELGVIKFWGDWNFIEAEQLYKKAYTLNPNDWWINYHNLEFLRKVGQHEDALIYAEKIMDLEPLNFFSYAVLGFAYYYVQDKQKAFEIFNNGLKFEGALYFSLAFWYYLEGNFEEACNNVNLGFDWWEKKYNKEPTCFHLAHAALYYYKNGDLDKSQHFLDRLITRSQETLVGSPNFYLAEFYSGIGKIEEAFKWLEKAYEVHSIELTTLKYSYLLQNLRNDPRYLSLYEKIGFKAYDEYIEKKNNE